LLVTGHNRTSKDTAVIIESQRIAPLNPEARLSSYHFARAGFKLQSNDQMSHVAYLDSGYGNSTVDRDYIAKHISNPQLHTLETPKEVRGIGGGIAMYTEILMLHIFCSTMDGK
jgi:hypothetical protein